MSQHMYADLAWQSPTGQPHQQQTYASASSSTISADATGAGLPSELDLTDFAAQMADITGPGSYASYGPSAFSGLTNAGGFFGSPSGAPSMFSQPFNSWSQPPVSTSSYSTLNGAISSSPTSTPQQSHAQPHTSSIDPSLSVSQSSSTTPPTNAYTHTPQFSPSQQFPSATPYPYSHISPAALSIPSHISNGSTYQQPQQAQSAQASSSQQLQPSVQTTVSPYAMHAPGSIMPSQFYSGTPTPTAISPSTSTQTAVLSVDPRNVTSAPEVSEARRERFRTGLAPLIQSKSFSGGARAVQTLVSYITEFGINEVDAATRLEILNKILQNAGNHYYRAWMENISALDITREWLKSIASSKADGQVLETAMPLLTLLDRIPFTGDSLKTSKAGKLVARMAKVASIPAVKDMASNIERKWREKFLGHAEPMDVDQDPQGKKRKLSDREREITPSRSTPPVKKLAVSVKTTSTSTVTVKRETTTTKSSTGVKDSKSDSSFFSAPKPKPKLPTFKKAPPQSVKKEDAANVAQPSSENPFQQALKEMEKSRQRASPAVPIAKSNSADVTPEPSAPAPSSASNVTSSGLTRSGKPRKRVTWAADGKLEMIRIIERAVYDDDLVNGATHAVHSNLRDLDKGEGAALHHIADTFEELVDWYEPPATELPPDISDRVRGGNSEEKNVQEQREAIALRAMYLSDEDIPESPSEPAPQPMPEQADAQTRVMLLGSEVEAFLFEQQQVAMQQPQIATQQPPQGGATPSVADLIGQLNPGAPTSSNPIAGIDLNGLVADPTQLQQLMAALSSSGIVAQQNAYTTEANGAAAWPKQPAQADTPSWTSPDTGYGQAGNQPASASTFDNGAAPDGSRWDGPPQGPRGGWRGGARGRGRGRGGRSRVPCSFFQQGRCKYGDQCDFSHEISYN